MRDTATDLIPALTEPALTQAAIVTTNQHFVHAFSKGHARRIASCYTVRGRLLPSDSNAITGRLAIQAFWQGVLDMGLCCTERHALEIQSAGHIGHEIGTYVLRLRSGRPTDQGIYVALWQWTGSCWQIDYDTWRSSRLRGWGTEGS